jgi:hypothetical protein
MSAKQQVVYSTEPALPKSFGDVYAQNCENTDFVRDAVDGSIEDLIETLVQVYTNSSYRDDDAGIILMSEVDELVREAVKEIVGDE